MGGQPNYGLVGGLGLGLLGLLGGLSAYKAHKAATQYDQEGKAINDILAGQGAQTIPLQQHGFFLPNANSANQVLNLAALASLHKHKNEVELGDRNTLGNKVGLPDFHSTAVAKDFNPTINAGLQGQIKQEQGYKAGANNLQAQPFLKQAMAAILAGGPASPNLPPLDQTPNLMPGNGPLGARANYTQPPPELQIPEGIKFNPEDVTAARKNYYDQHTDQRAQNAEARAQELQPLTVKGKSLENQNKMRDIQKKDKELKNYDRLVNARIASLNRSNRGSGKGEATGALKTYNDLRALYKNGAISKEDFELGIHNNILKDKYYTPDNPADTGPSTNKPDQKSPGQRYLDGDNE